MLTTLASSKGVFPGTMAETLVRLPTTNATRYVLMGGVCSKRYSAMPSERGVLDSMRVLKSTDWPAGAVMLKLKGAWRAAWLSVVEQQYAQNPKCLPEGQGNRHESQTLRETGSRA